MYIDTYTFIRALVGRGKKKVNGGYGGRERLCVLWTILTEECVKMVFYRFKIVVLIESAL